MLAWVSDDLPLAALAHSMLSGAMTLFVTRGVTVAYLNFATDIYTSELFKFRPANLNIIVLLVLAGGTICLVIRTLDR